jgi:hypothetical protein
MPDFYIKGNTFAAPFVSEPVADWITAETPEEALQRLSDLLKPIYGLYAAQCYKDANAASRNEKPLARWLSNHEIAKQKATEHLGAYSYLGEAPGRFRINDEWFDVDDPKGGRIIEANAEEANASR